MSTLGLEVETGSEAAIHVETHRAVRVDDLPFAVFLAKAVSAAEPERHFGASVFVPGHVRQIR